MRNVILLLTGALVVMSPIVQAEEESPHSFTANVALSTDYRFRGITQTTEDPALSGGFDYAYLSSAFPVGIFLGVWASNIDFNEGSLGVSDTADLEIDFYGGFTGTFPIGNGVGWKIGGLYYAYPGSDTSPALTVDYDYAEAYGVLSYDFGIFNVAGSLYYSPDYFAETDDGIYYSGDVGVPLPYEFTLSGHVGYQEIDNNAGFGTPDYTDWMVSLAKSWNIFTFKLAYIDTDIDDAECFGGTDFCDGTGVFTVSSSF
ncbi:MAG: uncharacterized protein HW411_616 [Gammaproteobacteria bacterium]|nr:uncharacterized protein [Gammaproteobacteria bacterium]